MKTKTNPVPPNIADSTAQSEIEDRIITAIVQEVVKNGLHGLRPGGAGYSVKVEDTARAAAIAAVAAARALQ